MSHDVGQRPANILNELSENAMNNAENNPSQAKQNAIEADTPGTTPAQETARADPATLSAELGSPDKRKPVSSVDGDDPDPLPDIDLDGITVDSGDPVQRANSRIVSVDSANMGASDNTVDTDGKGLEAMRDEPLQRDNVIGSNATLINNVAAPAVGLGGVDSRPEGNLPQIALRAGWKMVYHGSTEEQGYNGGRVEHLISIVRER
jgi:hypothetical protein